MMAYGSNQRAVKIYMTGSMKNQTIRQLTVRIYRWDRLLAYACGISGVVLYFIGRTPEFQSMQKWSAVLLVTMFILFCLSYLIFAVLKALPAPGENTPEKKS